MIKDRYKKESKLKSLSKSTTVMFLFDLVILYMSTYLWARFFEYTPKAIILLCFLVVTIGLIVLFLKGNYKIREFNINIKNTYLLFEGVVMTHVLPAAYLLTFAASITSTLKFLVVNIVRQAKLKFCDTKLKYLKTV